MSVYVRWSESSIKRSTVAWLAAAIAWIACGTLHNSATRAATADASRTESDGAIKFERGLAISGVSRAGRSALRSDAVEALIVADKWSTPKDGTEVMLADGSTKAWQPIQAAEDGSFTGPALRGGYLYFSIPSDADCVMILEAAGHSLVYVNGTLRGGDPYSHGYVQLPIMLRKGENEFLFLVGRGRLAAKLKPATSPLFATLADATLPDLIADSANDSWAGILVTNATRDWIRDESIEVRVASGGKTSTQRTTLPAIPPLATRKIPVRLQLSKEQSVRDQEAEFTISLSQSSDKKAETTSPADPVNFKLRVAGPEQTHKRTFLSKIDGSVQYYGIVPAKREPTNVDVNGKPDATDNKAGTTPPAKPALVLTLHGAGVEGIGQAACFTPKSNLITVAPTNRRPFGFDWEDWGRMDAMEVLQLVEEQFQTDPRRTYLTGHSMGGHGTWYIGANYPTRFAAIGPSAGWISMFSYAGARRPENPDPMLELLSRASAPSDTLLLAANYAQHGVYVLHGDQDDNVPVTQARTMRQRLAEFHPDFVYREQPGAGHWWGNACVDWQPMTEYFLQHTISNRQDVRHVQFTTVSPGISSRSHWAVIDAQQQVLQPSTIDLTCDPKLNQFRGKTTNVARLALDLDHLTAGTPIQVEIDDKKLESLPWPEATDKDGSRQLWLEREGENWKTIPRPSPASKGAHRYGPFKEAFNNRMVFVYGTAGTPTENDGALAKARFDAERFWYQGNGSIEIVSDAQYQEMIRVEADQHRDRNVILYGNADTNSAWAMLLSDSPVQVRRGAIRVDNQEMMGENLAALFVRPRKDSERALVGVVSGSGPAGQRLLDRMSYFVSGAGFPDCLVVGEEMLQRGAEGLRAVGFFGLDWSVKSGEFRFRTP